MGHTWSLVPEINFLVAISEEIEHTCFLHDAAELNGLAF